MYSVVTTNQDIAFYGMRKVHAASFCARTLVQSSNNLIIHAQADSDL